MPVEMIVDSIDSVDESIRGAYVEAEDGKFTLDPDKYAEVKAQGLKSKNKELLGKLSKANDGLKKFEKLQDFEDDDLAELLELREQKKNPPPPDPNKGKSAEGIAEFEKTVKKLKDAAAAKESELTSKLDEANKQIKHFKLTVPLREIALKSGVLPEDLNLVMLETGPRFTLDEQDKIVVLDEDGDPTEITPQRFFELYKEQRPKFFAASGASGSGAPAATAKGSAGKKTITRSEFDALDQASRMAKIKDGYKIED